MTRTLYIFDQGLKGLVGHYYEYVRSIVEAAEAAGIRCVVGCHEEAGDGSFASFELHPVFRDDVWATLAGEDHHSAASMTGVSARFVEDARKVLAKHPMQQGDIVFLPNIAKPHIVAAALMAERFGPRGARLHFMFRYPSSHFEGETAADAFRRLELAAEKYDVSLCTDSHRLADNLSPLTSLPFTVFPIPHTWHGQAEAATADDPNRPIHCVSLGNARDEKGMAEILEAVRLSAREPWGQKLRFTLQVNDPYQVADAIEAFREGPRDRRVTLLYEPLGSAEYARLLESADVVLVPYWRSIYRERTSGVFLEGLITGKLVLCTSDTWMSDLFDLHGGGVAIDDRSGTAVFEGLRQIVERRAELQERARRAAEYWKAVHCPENLIAHLTGENPRPATQLVKRGKAAVLFPWGEAVSGKTGASLRLKYFVRFMESVYDEVRIIFTGGAEPGGTIGKRSKADPVHYSDHAKKLHDQLKAVCREIRLPEEDCYHLWFHLWPEHDELLALRCEEMVLWADHVYVDYTYFVPLVDRLCREHSKPYTLTIHDIVSDQSAGTPFLHQATRTLEFDAARKAPRVICISEADRAVLDTGGIRAEIIRPAIDALEAIPPFTREEARAILRDVYDLPVDKRRLCFFVGSYFPPNVEAAGAIAAMARRCEDDPRFKDVFFVVAGACMKSCRSRNFAALGIIEGAGLSACMSLAEVTLVPLLRGTGVSLKSVEGLARGALILSTSVGMRGLEVVDGVHCRIEDDLAFFPERIAEMLADDEGAQRMREAARAFGEQFDFRRLMALYVPGAPFRELAETADEFAARRQQAIEELLPRIAKVRNLSPLLSKWKNEYANPQTSKRTPSEIAGEVDAALPGLNVGPVPDSFDADWYLGAYPDVAMLGMDPAEHYAWIGRALGRAPNGDSVKKKDGQPKRPTSSLARSDASLRQSKRWFLADPSLVNSSGHCARYLLAVAAPLRARGDTVHILGNHLLRSDSADLADCEPLFTLRCEEAPFIPNADPTSPTSIKRLQRRRTELLWEDLERLDEKYVVQKSDVLLINSLRHWSLEAVVEWLERLGAARAPTVILILHYSPHPQLGVPDPAAGAYKSAFRRIAESPLGSRIVLCTDSERLREEYQSLYDVPITVVPVPHCPEPSIARRERADISIVFAGEARRDKGIHLLPTAIREIFARSRKSDVTFNIQAYRDNAFEEQAAWAELAADGRVRIHPDPLSEAEYEAFIGDADLILIPYLCGPYRAQTSGVYCEAAALGIPVVVPANTWMADQVTKHGGGILFEPGDATSLAKACIEAIENCDSLREIAVRAAPAWRAFHNGSNFVACLDELVQPLLIGADREGSSDRGIPSARLDWACAT